MTLDLAMISWNHQNLKLLYIKAVVPNLFGTRDQFPGRQFFHGLGRGGDGEMVQAVMQAMGSGRWSFTHLPASHLLLCSPNPSRPWTTASKDTIYGVKRQPTGWGEKSANQVSDEGLICRIYKELLQLNKKKITNRLNNGQRTQIFLQRCSSSLIIREMKIKTTRRYRLTLKRLGIVKNQNKKHKNKSRK